MRKLALPLALILVSLGCSTQTQKPTHKSGQKEVKNSYITDDKDDQSDTFKANINKIRINDTNIKIQRSPIDNKSTVVSTIGQASIQIKCTYRGYFNFHWVNVTLEEGKHYAAYCVGDTAEAFIGKKADALYAFVSNQNNLESNKKFNQAIIDTPPTDSLTAPIANGKTRVILFNKKSTVLGFDNSFPHNISVNNQYKELVYPNKYVVLDIPNGTHELKLEYTDVFTFKKQIQLHLTGNTIYLESINGASSISANMLNSAPNDFTTIYKPNNLRRYFKQDL